MITQENHSKKVISLCIEQGVLGKVDESRGLITRSAYINDILSRFVGGTNDSE